MISSSDSGNSSYAAGLREALERYVPLLVWAVAVLVIFLIPLKIVGYGYLPSDDALRHAGKVVSGKSWEDVLVIREGFGLDHNPGWHAVLGVVHKLGAGTDGLVAFAVASLFLAVGLSAFPWVRRPEAWIAALLVACLTSDYLVHRLFLGRPYLLTAAVLIVLLFLWTRQEKDELSPGLIAMTAALVTLTTWIHGSWYLFAVPVAAFALAGRIRHAAVMGGCWLGGSFIGAALTGHPIEFLGQAIRIVTTAFGQHTVQRVLVSEFQPYAGEPAVVLAVVIVLILSRSAGRRVRLWHDPVFILLVLCWMLGFKVIRFWLDWGIPALFVWLAREIQVLLEEHLPWDSFRRLGMATGMAAALYLMVTADLDGRWTSNLTIEYLTPEKEDVREWLPGEEGIVYSASMRIFYQTFFKNPDAPWRYILGFEPTFMPPDDLAILRNIQWNFYTTKAYVPWVEKMKAADRMVMTGSSGNKPDLPQLEWYYAVSGTWIGRVPQGTNDVTELKEEPQPAPAPAEKPQVE